MLIIELVLVSPNELRDSAESKTQTPSASGDTQPIASENIEQVMAGIHVIETRNERKEWELWSDRAIGLKNAGDLSLEKVKANFFSQNGVNFLVTGKSGSVESKSKNMTVNGDVQTRSSNGYLFHTSVVNYNSEQRTLNSPDPVRVAGTNEGRGQSLSLEGQRMAADLDKGEIVITELVKAKKKMNGDQNLNVTAEQVTLSGRQKSMLFKGNVKIELNGVNISGPSALFNYNSDSHLLESIDLDGGIRVNDFDKWATSEKLRIDIAKNSYVFDGKPRLVQDNDEVRGDKIIFLDGGKKVKVHNAKVKVSQETLEGDPKGVLK